MSRGKSPLRNGDHDPGPLPSCTTTCRHCGQVYRSVPVPIIGQAPEKRHQDFVQSLATHIAQKHPEIAAKELIHPQMVYGLALVGANFTTDDEGLAAHFDEARHQTHLRTLRRRLPDQAIVDKLAPFSLEPETHTRLFDLIASIRDVYEERIQPLNQSSSIIRPA